MMYLFQRGVTGIREFDGSILVGILLGSLLKAWRFRWCSKPAGALLVRLVGRRGWLGFVAIATVAAALYWIGDNFGWNSAWIGYTTGVGFGWIVVAGVQYMGLRRLDLRENGLVLSGEWYWPWSVARLIKWRRETTGQLVIGRDWRRIVAVVPTEQREAVDAVLHEKLRTSNKVTEAQQ
jgi:hypothetical protein